MLPLVCFLTGGGVAVSAFLLGWCARGTTEQRIQVVTALEPDSAPIFDRPAKVIPSAELARVLREGL